MGVCVCFCVHDIKVKSKIRADTMINQKYTSFLSKSRFGFHNMNCNIFLILQVSVTSIFFFTVAYLKHRVTFTRRKVKIEIAVTLKELRSSFVSVLKT